MKQLLSIEIYGTIRGTIWMPAIECTKEVHCKFTPKQQPFTREWTGIRDALLHLTNDGDFQSCMLEDVSLRVTWAIRHDFVTRWCDLPVGEEINDLVSVYH